MPDQSEPFRFIADKGDARLRLDRILVRRVTSVSRLSRNTVQQWIESGAVCVDGVPALRAATRVREGATVDVVLPSTAILRTRPQPESAPLAVLFEDETLIVVDKEPGVVVHPSYKQTSGTLLNATLGRIRGRDDLQPGIVTRLDKDTSGIVLIALTPSAHAALQRAAAQGRVIKQYLAIVRGSPQPARGRIELPLGRDADDRRRMIVMPGGAPSETVYETLSVHESPAGPESLVQCALVTGRTHQIRVHLAASGWPIVGDRTYGSPDPRISRQALHSWRISFPHPITGRPIDLEAPMPGDMQAVWGEQAPGREQAPGIGPQESGLSEASAMGPRRGQIPDD